MKKAGERIGFLFIGILLGIFITSLFINSPSNKVYPDNNIYTTNEKSANSLYTTNEKYCEKNSDCTKRDNCCNSCHKDYVNIYNTKTPPKEECKIELCTQDCPSPESYTDAVCVNNECVPEE